MTAEIRSFVGPIPPAEILGGYGQVNATFPERIVAMAENEQAFRHEQEREDGRFIRRWMNRGQFFGVALGTMMLGIAAYAIYNNQPWVAGTAIGSVASLVGVFIWRERTDTKSDNDKS